MNKADIVLILKQGVCNVAFTKADGSVRLMKATLKSDLIEYETAGTSKPESDDLVTVWDVEKGGWRRFKISSLIEDPSLE